jgi:alanine-glyoxylate transaminase/serine-glyoxylate transaminase/serine-pyruvate transaminase
MTVEPALAPASFEIKPRILLGPGPSIVSARVLAAMSQPVVGHLDPQFAAVMDRTQEMLRAVFQTANRLTFPCSATGSGGMEAALVNVLEPGDEAIVGVAGYFGARLHEIATRTGATIHRLDKPWGEVFETQEIADALKKHPKTRLVALVHGETSTGMMQPLQEIGALCRASDRLFLVDAVATLGGTPLPVDTWQIDVCYSGSQKCLGAPPGLAPITFSARAEEKLRSRQSKVQSWYFDAAALSTYWTLGEGRRAYHHTAPVSMVYALHEALRQILEEGLEARFERHAATSRMLLEGMQALGFRPFGRDGDRMPMLTGFLLPPGLDDAPTRKRLLDDHGIEVAAALGEMAGKMWRVGLMGESATRENVAALLAALRGMP